MKLLIDDLSTTGGWVSSDPLKAVVHGVNEIESFIAGLNTPSSLVLKWEDGGVNSYIEKTGLSHDVSQYKEIVFHLWSRNKKKKGVDYITASDFAYKLDLGGGNEYLIPTYSSFTSVVIDVSDVNTITQIRFTSLNDDEDYLIVSYMVAVTHELPLDIFRETKTAIEYFVVNEYDRITDGVNDKGILIGTVDASVDDNEIIISGALSFLEQYAVILIDDGVNSETHLIKNVDRGLVSFYSDFDGDSIINSFTGANVYIKINVGFGLKEDEIRLPGISIWGFAPEPKLLSNKEDLVRDTMLPNGSVSERTIGQLLTFSIIIDCEARHYELLAYLSMVVRKLISREFLWLNGRQHYIEFSVAPSNTEPVEGINEIPKIEYIMSIDVKEDIWDRETKVPAININTTVAGQLSSPGGLNE